MAFPLYLTALWLLWVLGRQTDVTHAVLVLVGMLLMVFAAWLYGLRPPAGSAWLRINVGVAAVSVIGALAILFHPGLRSSAPGPAAIVTDAPFWEPYSADRFAALRASGRPIFLNITADWCISCIANERVALSVPSVRKAIHAAGVVPLKGDWTNGDPALTEILESFGRNGVPLYVLYPADPSRPPQLLPQWLTPMSVLESVHALVPGPE
ncbi:MAG: thioredoxin family protein [Candidatus Accumulibacter meliphilus]|uniref:thioredoxin family protein n=1 Tax=Candidatus Accumulibacter meliphilus TaxID=2211374 RepID=UPI002FC2EC5D